MEVTIVNLGPVPLPVVTNERDDGTRVPVVNPGASYDVDGPTVVSVGDNPSMLEEFAEALAGMAVAIAATLAKLFTWWSEHNEKGNDVLADPVRVDIVNRGTNALRVCLGSNTNDVTVEVGVTYTAEAPRYVEIRELGV